MFIPILLNNSYLYVKKKKYTYVCKRNSYRRHYFYLCHGDIPVRQNMGNAVVSKEALDFPYCYGQHRYITFHGHCAVGYSFERTP